MKENYSEKRGSCGEWAQSELRKGKQLTTEEFTEQQIKTVCPFHLSVCLLYRNTIHSHVYTLNQKDLF